MCVSGTGNSGGWNQKTWLQIQQECVNLFIPGTWRLERVVCVVHRKLAWRLRITRGYLCRRKEDCDIGGVTLDLWPKAASLPGPCWIWLFSFLLYFLFLYDFFSCLSSSLPSSFLPHTSLHPCGAPAPCQAYILLMVSVVTGQGLRPQERRGCSAPESMCPFVS